MNTLEITVQRKSGKAWPVVVEQSRPGAFLPIRSEGVFALDRITLMSQVTPRNYGTILGKSLFYDTVRDAFIRARAESNDQLRLLLFVEAPDLWTLRWERLCAPLDNRWDFLALDQRTPFSLYLPSIADRRFPPIGRRDLRALVMVASPLGLEQYHLSPFDVATAVTSVRTALGDIPCDVLATVEGAVGPPTLDALCKRITAEPYTLLHLICHGRFSLENDETVLYLAQANGQVDPVSRSRLLEQLSRLRGARGLPHFAFLATCESASPEVGKSLGGLAQRLVRELGMPAVIAMTEAVSLETAWELAENFYCRLRMHGEVDVALAEACAGLAERPDITVPALYSRLGGRSLFSDALDRDLTNSEIGFGLDCLEKLLAERAPVLCQTFDMQATTLRGILGVDAAAVSMTAHSERERAQAEIKAMCEEILDLNFNALALEQNPPPYDSRCPFRGLYPFHMEEQEFFFGRESLIKRLQQRLAEYPFLAVLGPSGSGKSSLILAGLIPALQKKEPNLQSVSFTPGGDPLILLEASLTKIPDQPALLVVDQFEEVFTLCTDEGKRRSFLDRLLTLVREQQVVITMRADFWGECAPYRALKEVMQAHQELIPPMDTTELRRAVEQQVATVGLRFEADLSNTILDDVRGEPGAMPLLQHALLELWKRRHGRWLRAEEYRTIGGVQQAIARTADAVYEELSFVEQERVRDIFIRLTRMDEDAVQGEERRDTRRRVEMRELVPGGSDPTVTKALVMRLANARLVVTSVNGVTGREEVEVAHEALIRYWPRLRDWLNEDRSNIQLREGISKAAEEWENKKKDQSYLAHRGNRLQEAEVLLRQPKYALNELERAYIGACTAFQEQEETRWKEQYEKAERQRQEAEQERLIALAHKLAAQSELLHNQYPHLLELSILLAVESIKRFHTVEADRVLRQGIALLRPRLASLRHRSEVIAVAFSPDGRFLATTNGSLLATINESHSAVLWDIATGKQLTSVSHLSEITALAFSPDGRLLATASGDHTAALWDVATGQQLTPFLHQGGVTAVAFSPDGHFLVTASRDFMSAFWDVSTGQQLTSFLHQGGVTVVAFSPDARLLATGSDDRTVGLWDISTGQQLASLSHQGGVTAVTFSPDGHLLATASRDHTAGLWDVSAGQQLASLPHQGEIATVAFSPDGHLLATGSSDHTAALWDAATGQQLTSFFHQGRVTDVAFSPHSRLLITSSEDCTAALWDISTRRRIALLLHQSRVMAVAFSPDGHLLATSSGDCTAALWAVSAEQRLTQVLHQGAVIASTFSPDGHLLATGSSDHTATLWDVSTGQQLASFLHRGGVTAVTFSPDGHLLATISDDHKAGIWDIAARRQLISLPHRSKITSASFSPDGHFLATASGDDTAILWKIPTGQCLTLFPHWNVVTALAFSPDGRFLATASEDGTAVLWKVPTGQLFTTLAHQSTVTALAFSLDGHLLATACRDKEVRLWKVPTGQLLTTLAHQSTVTALAFSLDGHLLAIASDNHAVEFWDVATGKQLTSLPHHDIVNAIAFSPDGSYFATASSDNTAGIWDVSTGRQLAYLSHEKAVLDIAFNPDGKYLATASADQTARVWLVRPKDLIAEARTYLTRNLTKEEWLQYIGDEPFRKTFLDLPSN